MMGLMDRDYMHEKGRERPFSQPPPDRFGALGKVLIFVALLFFLYKVADWRLNQRAAKLVSTPPAATPEPVSRAAESAAPSFPQTPTYPSAPEATGSTRTITKCVVDGKTSYGDGSCAAGAKTTHVVTKENHNLMEAVRVTAATKTEEPAPPPAIVAQSNQGFDRASMKSECNALEERIKYLDAMARQPQSGQTQDWIKTERKRLRDLQYRIPCQ